MSNISSYAITKRLFGDAAHKRSELFVADELSRIARNDEHWNFYYGNQWDFQRVDNEPLVTMNLVMPLIDKSVAFLAGGGFQITVPTVLQNHTLPVLRKTWEANGQLSISIQAALMGAVTGDVWFLVTYQPPTELHKKLNPYAKGQIKLILLDSSNVIAEWNPSNREELRKVTIVTEYFDTGELSFNGSQKRTKKKFIQEITPEKIIERRQDEDDREYENVLGEIPVIHISNMAVPNDFYGMSDLDGGILDAQRELNEKHTDISDIINYNGSPITVIKGAKANQLERGPKQTWSGLPSNSSVEYLTLTGGIDSYIEYVKQVRQAIFEQAQVPEKSLGGAEHYISNTSGVALQMELSPLIEKTNKKKAEYEKGFEKINYFILRIKQITEGFILPMDLCENCGGKIHEYQDARGFVRRKCYEVDPQTFDFLDPEEALVTVIREHSIGREIREIPFRQFKEEYGNKYTSFWDPADTEIIDHDKEGDGEKDTSSPDVKAPKGQGPLQLKTGLFKFPEEPETFTQTIVVGTNEDGTSIIENRTTTAIPTGCKRPSHLDPFKNSIAFNSTLPKDKHLDLGYVLNAVNGKVRSRKWAMEEIGVENIEDETQQILKEQAIFGIGTKDAQTDVIEDEPAVRSTNADTLSQNTDNSMRQNIPARQNVVKQSDIARRSPSAGNLEAQ